MLLVIVSNSGQNSTALFLPLLATVPFPSLACLVLKPLRASTLSSHRGIDHVVCMAVPCTGPCLLYVLCVPGYGELGFLLMCDAQRVLPAHYPVRWWGLNLMIEFPYCAGCGVWSVPFDAFRYPMHEFDWSYICEIVYHNFHFHAQAARCVFASVKNEFFEAALGSFFMPWFQMDSFPFYLCDGHIPVMELPSGAPGPGKDKRET